MQMSQRIHIKSRFLTRLAINFGLGILFSVGIAHGGDVKIKKIGERVLLYEYMSVSYLRLAEALPLEGGDPAQSKEFAAEMHYQSAMYAFMSYIDRSRVQSPPSRNDMCYRALIGRTSKLMKKIDWEKFEDYVKREGLDYISGFFDGYDAKLMSEDLRGFKESINDSEK